MQPTLETLAALLPGCALRDRARLSKRLETLERRLASGQDIARAFAELNAEALAAVERCEERRRQAPVPTYPDDLPVVQRKDEIAAIVREHQVVVICGETGSGKSTQLPKILLELGRGVTGMIAHTQPRRIAARTLAMRIAAELHSEVGRAVGYKVRFNDHVGPDSYIKLLTDGMLLAETERDRLLEQYDTVIIDEAHERSLNIDFLLGYLKQLLPRRPDLKVVITSATIDPERFSTHFGGAPIIEVSGRTYPVETRYRARESDALEEGSEPEDEDHLVSAVHELLAEGPGDILVFLPTERAIRETMERLHGERIPRCEVLPLFARLSAAEQTRIFAEHSGRRIVLATNVAETSLTVPGIRYVIDTGLARVSRYDVRRGVARLPIERVSQASAQQRAGRCGRVSAGICVRLYSEEDYLSRPAFTPPEIVRTNLAAVILKMAALGLGDVERFPFVEAPDRRSLRDGYDTLLELGAIDAEYRLTGLGQKLARLPVDPRVARMILAAQDQRCLRDVLVIAAALSVQDPRERPPASPGRADEAHRRFAGEDSDFSFFVTLMRAYEQEAANLTRSKRKQWCEKQFISYPRMLEWIDIHGQLVEIAAELGLSHGGSEARGDDAAVHRALLTGLLRNVAMRFDDKTYVGARNVKMSVFPGSVLFKKRPPWIMAAEVIETERLYARIAAKIDPEWIEPLAEHLVAKSYSEPHWDARRGQVVGYEKVTLYGLPLVTQRKVDWARIDAEGAREIFIRSALVEGQLETRGAFMRHNAQLIERLESLREKLRSRDVVVDDQAVYAFFDARVPPSVASAVAFERWRKDAERQDSEVLHLRVEDVLSDRARAVSDADYPAVLTVGGHDIPLRYRFDPGDPEDGITAVVPLPIVHRLPTSPFEWLVPGLLLDKMAALLESLPKAIRRELITAGRPAGTISEIAAACRDHLAPRPATERPLVEGLTRALSELGSPRVDPASFRLEMIPPHLLMRFEVRDEAGQPVAASRDLAAMQAQLLVRASNSFVRLPKGNLERSDVTGWDFGDLPREVSVPYGGGSIPGYPALRWGDGRVSLVVADTADRAETLHRAGVRALLARAVADVSKHVRRTLPGMPAACLQYALLGTCDELKDSIIDAAIDRICGLGERSFATRTRAEFDGASRELRGRMAPVADEIAKKVSDVLAAYQRVVDLLARGGREHGGFGVVQVRAHLERLVYRGFVRDTPWAALEQLPRYVRAVELRLIKMRENPAKHQARAAVVEPLFAQLDERMTRAAAAGRRDPAVESYRWLLEEFHLFTFAEELKPAKPVSQKRLAEAWTALG